MLFYIRNELCLVVITDLSIVGLESLFVKVKDNDVWYVFAVHYHLLNQTGNEISFFLDSFDTQLCLLRSLRFLRFPKFISVNLNDRYVDRQDSHASSELQLIFVNLLSNYRLSQLIQTPTRGKHIF